MTTIARLKQEFLEYIEIEKGRAIRTVENYDHYLTVFLNHGKYEEPKDITPEKIKNIVEVFDKNPKFAKEMLMKIAKSQANENNTQQETILRKLENQYEVVQYGKPFVHNVIQAGRKAGSI